MSRLLYIQASPRGEQSKSNLIARADLNGLRENTRESHVDMLSDWESELPKFDGDKVAAKIAVMKGR